MNKIFNWVAGGFFRTLGKFLMFLVVGILFTLFLSKSDSKIGRLLGIGYVYADTITTSSNEYLVQTCSGPNVCDYTIGNSTYNTGYINMNTQFQNIHGPNDTKQFMTSIRLRQQFASSNYLQTGVTYTFRYKFNFDSKLYSYRKPNTWTYNLSVVNSSGASSDINAGEYNVSFSNVTNDTYALYITLTYTPNQTLKQVSLQVKFPYANTYDFGYGPTTLWQEQIFAINYKQLTITSNQDSTTTDAINNQTTIIQQEIDNTNNTIINSTEEIINNQNENTQAVIDSNKVCTYIDKNNTITNGFLDINGDVYGSSSSYGITDFLTINDKSTIELLTTMTSPTIFGCFYNINKVKISCFPSSVLGNVNVPSNVFYVKFSVYKNLNVPTYKICKNGNQAVTDSLTDYNVDGATNEGASFFNDFTTNTHGLTGIITAPLNAINSLTSSTCSPLHLPIPFLTNKYLDLPCMRAIYVEHFGSFMTLYDTITLGIVSYWIMVRIFALVKDFKNPDHDEIEVVDL